MDIKLSDIKVGKRYRKSLGDLDKLIASIEDVGLLQPVVITPDRKLIAGYRRVKAFKKMKRAKIPAIIAEGLDDAVHLLKAERDENTCREPFSVTEAVAIGTVIGDMYRPIAESRQKASTSKAGKASAAKRKGNAGKTLPHVETKRDETTRTTAQAAESVGMSRPTFEKAESIIQAAEKEPEKYQPLVDEMNKTGKVDGVAKKYKKQLKELEDKKAAQKAKREIKGKKSNGVFHGDSFVLGDDIPDKTCALVFTDPPYDKKSLPMFGQLGKMAGRILVDGGSLITYCGQYSLPEVIESLGEHVKFYWPLCCLHTGKTARMKLRGIKVKWKPMLWFVKGSGRRDTHTWVEDLVVSQQEKDSHPWQQSVIEASYYIERLTVDNDLVVDPFCGGGTTAIAAKQLGRQWWTADINASHVATARKRVSECQV